MKVNLLFKPFVSIFDLLNDLNFLFFRFDFSIPLNRS